MYQNQNNPNQQQNTGAQQNQQSNSRGNRTVVPEAKGALNQMKYEIASELGIPVLLSKEPTDCAALGLGNIIENYDLLQHLGRTSFLHEF